MALHAEDDTGDGSLIEHLIELRMRLMRGLAGTGLVLVCLLPFANTLYGMLAQPLLDKLPDGAHLIAIEVASPFFAPLKLAFFTALVVTMPWLLYQAWAFVAPGLYSHEKRLVLPLVRPAMATVAVFTMIPIWNDLWFPLILAPSEATKTVTLGSQVFIGQFVTDWNAVLSALSMAIIPVLVLYVIFSRQLIRGITSGAVK